MREKVLVLALLFVVPLSAGQAERPVYFSFDESSFSATGKWVPTDAKEKPPFPSETELDCFKNDMSCVEATAEYYYGHPHVTVSFLRAIKWDKDGIIATSSSGICMTNTVLVSFADKTISATDSMKRLTEGKKKACNFLGAEKTETWRFILRGSAEWDKEQYGIGK